MICFQKQSIGKFYQHRDKPWTMVGIIHFTDWWNQTLMSIQRRSYFDIWCCFSGSMWSNAQAKSSREGKLFKRHNVLCIPVWSWPRVWRMHTKIVSFCPLFNRTYTASFNFSRFKSKSVSGFIFHNVKTGNSVLNSLKLCRCIIHFNYGCLEKTASLTWTKILCTNQNSCSNLTDRHLEIVAVTKSVLFKIHSHDSLTIHSIDL